LSKIRFEKLKLRDIFIFQEQEYVRIQDQYVGCCDVRYNAKSTTDEHKVLIPNYKIVEKNE